MSDPGSEPKGQGPSLVERLAYSLGFAVIAYLTLLLLFALAVAQFVVRALDAKPNEELTRFVRRLVAYLAEVGAYVALASDKRPFPMGEFPADPA